MKNRWEDATTRSETPIGEIAGSPKPGRWNKWVTQQGEVWVDRDNNVFKISQMSQQYAFNALRFTFMNHPWDILPNWRTNPLVLALYERLSEDVKDEADRSLALLSEETVRKRHREDRDEFEMFEDLERYHHPQDLIGG